jgi:hypothetical protein
MTTIDRPLANLATNWERISSRLNGSLHEKSLWVYAIIVVAHWMEHLIQAYQIYLAGWARPDAKGMLGLWMPTLVTTEILHFTYAVFVIGGLILLRPGFYGRARVWWDIALLVQAWHLFEHSILQWQAIAGDFFFGASVPISFLQVWIPRVELHLLYNIAVTVPTLVGLFYHRYPPKGERQHRVGCGCSVRPSEV